MKEENKNEETFEEFPEEFEEESVPMSERVKFDQNLNGEHFTKLNKFDGCLYASYENFPQIVMGPEGMMLVPKVVMEKKGEKYPYPYPYPKKTKPKTESSNEENKRNDEHKKEEADMKTNFENKIRELQSEIERLNKPDNKLDKEKQGEFQQKTSAELLVEAWKRGAL